MHMGILDEDTSTFEVERYSPRCNENAISLIKQPDGNWIGEMQRNGVLVEVREVGPETALQKLLTHG